ncbi:hypothetical protein SEUCBS140593_008965 [Sporothrix eucalyptigena]|uniref:Class II aldolase/adducin N-terminal domain-containing protein n=1 Tax=Sporothrix eucalyptigena TaxID=1812306 RepID=A0ABP0CR09_9PEZI
MSSTIIETAPTKAVQLVAEPAPAEEVEPLKAMAHQGKGLPGIPTFATHAETRKWQLEHMAAAFRVFGREGYVEGISGHISVRDPEFTNRFWINPLGVHFSMMRASDMICVNLAGEVVGGNTAGSINAAGFQIHSAVHRTRPDPLEMINQDVCYFYNAHTVYDQYGGIANEADEGARIAASLGTENKAAILLNHGLLTVGQTVDEAAFLFCLMERSCRVQMLTDAASMAGKPKMFVSDEEAAYNYRMASTPDCLFVEFQPHYRYEEWVSPDFKN